MNAFNRRDGFTGQRMIVVPNRLIHKMIRTDPLLAYLYITQIGYFPKAMFHYRERRYGCTDNILLYCTHGKGWYVIGKTHYELSANQYVILPATDQYIRYGADNSDPWSIYWIHFTGTAIELFNEALKITPGQGPLPIPYNRATLDLWSAIYRGLEKPYSRENMFHVILSLHACIALFRSAEATLEHSLLSSGKMVADTVAYMKEHIGQRIPVDAFAARCNLSASYFSNLFKQETGKAPLEYFIELKMQHACTLLVSGRVKIKEVAELTGYDDPYYFCRIFKKTMKISPRGYMKMNQTSG